MSNRASSKALDKRAALQHNGGYLSIDRCCCCCCKMTDKPDCCCWYALLCGNLI
jgi:hypothetical protein